MELKVRMSISKAGTEYSGKKIGRDLISPSSFQLWSHVKCVFLLSLIPGELILQIT